MSNAHIKQGCIVCLPMQDHATNKKVFGRKNVFDGCVLKQTLQQYLRKAIYVCLSIKDIH